MSQNKDTFIKRFSEEKEWTPEELASMKKIELPVSLVAEVTQWAINLAGTAHILDSHRKRDRLDAAKLSLAIADTSKAYAKILLNELKKSGTEVQEEAATPTVAEVANQTSTQEAGA